MLVGAVQRLFDGKYPRVLGRRFDERNHGIVGIEGVVQQNIVAAEFLEQILRLGGEPKFARDKSFELEIGMRRLLVNIEQAREIHRTVDGKNLPGLQFEVGAQAFDDFGISIGFDLQAHGIAFPPVMQLSTYGFQQVARFLLRQIKIAIAGDAECGRRYDVVAVIHARRVERDQIGQKDEIVRSLRGQPYQSWQSSWHRDHSGVSERGPAAAAKQETHR